MTKNLNHAASKRAGLSVGLRLALWLYALSAPVAVSAKTDQETIFIAVDDPPNAEAMRFYENKNPALGPSVAGTYKILVVYAEWAKRRPSGVEYFRVDQTVDCASKIVTNGDYVAYDTKGSVVAKSVRVPADALVQVPVTLLGGMVEADCPSDGPPGLTVHRGNQGRENITSGIDNALERARGHWARIEKARSLSPDGKFYRVAGPDTLPEVTMFIDGSTFSRVGDTLHLWILLVNSRKSSSPGYMSRSEIQVDCNKRIFRQTFRASFDASGALELVAGDDARLLYSENPWDRPILGACEVFPPPGSPEIFRTLRDARAASH